MSHPASAPIRRRYAPAVSCGEFRDDQPIEWTVTVLYTLPHAAADEVSSGRIDQQSAAELVHGSVLSALQAPNPHPHRAHLTPRRHVDVVRGEHL